MILLFVGILPLLTGYIGNILSWNYNILLLANCLLLILWFYVSRTAGLKKQNAFLTLIVLNLPAFLMLTGSYLFAYSENRFIHSVWVLSQLYYLPFSPIGSFLYINSLSGDEDVIFESIPLMFSVSFILIVLTALVGFHSSQNIEKLVK